MTTELRLARTELFSTGVAYQPAAPRIRNLGDAILLSAIADYRGENEQAHEEAEQFLYPQTPDWQDQYDWAVGLAGDLNPGWLRDALDRSRRKWDGQRAARKRRPRKKAS